VTGPTRVSVQPLAGASLDHGPTIRERVLKKNGALLPAWIERPALREPYRALASRKR
jgi:hypothetical protein